MTIKTAPTEGAIYSLDIMKANRYRVMAVTKSGKFERRVYFTDVATGATGNMELKQFNNNFKPAKAGV